MTLTSIELFSPLLFACNVAHFHIFDFSLCVQNVLCPLMQCNIERHGEKRLTQLERLSIVPRCTINISKPTGKLFLWLQIFFIFTTRRSLPVVTTFPSSVFIL